MTKKKATTPVQPPPTLDHEKIDQDQQELDNNLAKKVERIRCGCAVDDLQHWVDDMTEKHKNKIPNSISNCSIYIIITTVLVLVLSVLTGYIIIESGAFQRNSESVRYNDQNLDLPSYKWDYKTNFFANETVTLFRNLALNGEKLSTIVEDNGVDTAGEAQQLGHVDCKHPFMTLNPQRTMCHFSNRLDVGMHFVKTGGFNGHIEYLDKMVARILPFRKRLIQQQSNAYSSYVNLKKLKEFNTPEFHKTANSICADNNAELFDKTKLDSIVNEIFQLDVLLMLPGQELPMHLNVPYFWGADRNNFPHWLLVVMKNSKLFEEIFIPQVQGISWLNTEYSNNELNEDGNLKKEFVRWDGEGGDFYLYPYRNNGQKTEDKKTEKNTDKSKTGESNKKKDTPSNKYVILKREYNSAIILDGAQIIHGVDRYKPNDLPPLFASNHHYTIRFDQYRNQWYLHDFQNNFLRSYYKDDVKLKVVWNMHCFANQSQQAHFHSKKVKPLTLEKIMDTFKKDLKAKKMLPSDNIEPIDLWTIALKEYLNYPVNTQNQSTTIFGFNYCLLPNIMPGWVKNIMNKFLNDRC